MGTRVLFLALVVSTFFLLQVVAEDLEIDSDLRSVWISNFAEEFNREFATKLVESGLSESDATEIINNLAVDAANCFSEVIRQVAAEESTDIDSPFLETDDEGQLKHLLDSCFLTALANAGLTLD